MSTMNKITVYFNPCTPAPSGGYKIYYRVVGTTDEYTYAGTFFVSPAVFYDHINLAGTCYEGYIISDCGNNIVGNGIPFETCGSGGSDYAIALDGVCTGILSSYTISGGIAGDTVVVRITFGGLLKTDPGFFTRANLSATSPDGAPQSAVSACYMDTNYHGFTLVVDMTLTMPSATSSIGLSAVTHNSNTGVASVTLEIISVNGNTTSIQCVGCCGNSSTGGTC